MIANEALAFFRRKLALASERVADLAYAVGRLEEDDAEAAATWVDSLAREVRVRDLEPHCRAARRQTQALGAMLEAEQSILAALEEIVALEQSVVTVIAQARTAAQSAEARAIESRRLSDSARSEVAAAESAVSAAAGSIGTLM
jgi:hypothetical protein